MNKVRSRPGGHVLPVLEAVLADEPLIFSGHRGYLCDLGILHGQLAGRHTCRAEVVQRAVEGAVERRVVSHSGKDAVRWKRSPGMEDYRAGNER